MLHHAFLSEPEGPREFPPDGRLTRVTSDALGAPLHDVQNRAIDAAKRADRHKDREGDEGHEFREAAHQRGAVTRRNPSTPSRNASPTQSTANGSVATSWP